MIEATQDATLFCNVCAHEWGEYISNDNLSPADGPHFSRLARPDPRSLSRGDSAPDSGRRRYSSIEDLVSRTGLRRDELATLAEIGALNAFGYDRRTALWQVEQVIRARWRDVRTTTATILESEVRHRRCVPMTPASACWPTMPARA